jgi:Ser/Thr protein kinase RdoA (MazF antagonist)
MPHPFSSLTHRGQARRLLEMARLALQEYPLNVKQIQLLTYHFNAIFRVDTEEGQKYVLRINLPGGRSLAEIRAETGWLAALRRDTPLIVPEPIPRSDGGFVTTVEARGVPEPRHCVIFSWVAGHDLAQEMTPPNYEKLGRVVAQLHQYAQTFRLPKGGWLRLMDKTLPFNHGEAIWDEKINGELMPPTRRAVFRETSDRVQILLDALFANPSGLRVLHADLHQYNIRVYRGQLRVLDFDDTMLGYPVLDVALSLYYIQAHPEYIALREAYQRGYESVSPWPETQTGQVQTYIAGRELQLVNYVLHTTNPLFAPRLPGFLARAEERLKTFLKE